MLQSEKILLQLGFKESIKKHNLFYKSFACGMLFVGMRGTKVIRLWDDSRPFVNIQHDENLKIPYWQRHRIIQAEFDIMTNAGLEFRTSLEASMEGNCICGWGFTPEKGFCPGNAGFCDWCDKDFQGDAVYCSEACKQDFLEHYHLCAACGKMIEYHQEHQHHYSYFPVPMTIPVHQKCHVLIHKSDKYSYLRPPPGDAERFYKKGIYAEAPKERKAIILPNNSPSMPKPTNKRLMTFRRNSSTDRRLREAYKRKHGR